VKHHLLHAFLVFLSLAFMAAHVITAGRLDNAGGLGWDGVGYARMLDDLDTGSMNTRLRPAIIVATRPVYRLVAEPVMAFRIMNYVYLALLTWALARLGTEYGISAMANVYLVATLGASIAVTQMFAFYAVLVDLGAQAVIALAIYAIVRGWPVATAVLAVASVLSRELGLAVLAFGIHRELRLGVPVRRIAWTYAPALAAAVAWRYHVTSGAPASDQVLTLPALLQNLRLWGDPLYAGFFSYFAVTLFGGVSLIIAANPMRAAGLFREQPEWLTYSTLILAATIIGNADIWRYLAYAAPVAVVLFAWCCREWSLSRQLTLFVLGGIATWITQHPFDPMNVSLYFRDWFPYYLATDLVSSPDVSLWPVWGWRFIACAMALWLFSWVGCTARR
jgi:hypothetical protein